MEVIGDFEYQKKDLIGHGAFAVVFKGRSRKRPHATVAIKSITKKNLAKSQNLLSKEIKILKELSCLHHDNVVGLLDCKETTNHVYLVMEYCNGGDLADYLQAKGTLSEDTIAVFFRQIAGAMKALVGKGIVHRDLKPQNILMCNSGKHNPPANDIILKIADFGFARFLQDGVMAGTLCGSPMYMAPEVIMSIQYDAKADLWSIGTIMFQCLTGRAPFQAQTPQQLRQYYEKNKELVPNIPKQTSPELRDLLLKLLKRNAKDRIDFDDFFNHSFLRPTSPAASSCPVAVPGRSQSFSSDGSVPKLTTITTSPLSGLVKDSPKSPVHKTCVDTVPNVVVPGLESPSDIAEFLKNETDAKTTSLTEQDFVMVPESIGNSSGTTTPRHSMEDDMDACSDPVPLTLKGVGAANTSRTFFKATDPQTSPSRPSTLLVQSPSSSPSSEPIPVPTHAQAYHRIHNGSPCSPSESRRRTTPTDTKESVTGQLSRQGSDTKLSGPDIGSLSPPSVQFSIGTPPNITWKRNSTGTPPAGRYGSTPPSVTGSPLRRSGTASPRYSPLPFGGPGSLPPILGSPTKAPPGFDFPYANTERIAHQSINPSFGSCRTQTVPDNMVAIAYGRDASSPPMGFYQRGRCNTEPALDRNMSGTSLLSQQLLKAAFANPHVGYSPPQVGNMVAFSGWTSPRERSGSTGNDRCNVVDRERSSAYFKRSSNTIDTSPPVSLLYAQSPPNMEGPVAFVAPELLEETLMDDHHKESMAKLSFVLDLVKAIMEIAKTRSTSLNAFTESVSSKQGEGSDPPRYNEAQRRLEQLVLYVRALHLLSSSLQLARSEVTNGNINPCNSLKIIVCQLNDHYHRSIDMCRLLQRQGTLTDTPLSPQSLVITADKLIYNYAIEMCQTAALDELFGSPEECFRKYHLAHILLHCLAQQARNAHDRELLYKYRDAVESRLFKLQSQGMPCPHDNIS